MKKKSIFGIKSLFTLISLLTSTMCFSICFASWVGGASGDSKDATGALEADAIVTGAGGEDVTCITNLQLDSFRYAAGYGFVNETNGRYATSMDLTGSFSFEVALAKTAIASFVSDKTFSLVIELNTTASITFGAPSITGGLSGSTITGKSVTSSAAASGAYNITLTNDQFGQTTLSDISFKIPMSVASASSFPDLTSVTFAVALTPGEEIV